MAKGNDLDSQRGSEKEREKQDKDRDKEMQKEKMDKDCEREKEKDRHHEENKDMAKNREDKTKSKPDENDVRGGNIFNVCFPSFSKCVSYCLWRCDRYNILFLIID